MTLEASGKLTEEDYNGVLPSLHTELERRGSLRLLIILRDFEGWTPKAPLEDLRFDLRHRKDFDRVAIVGERTVEALVTKLTAPIFSGEMRFFEDEVSARNWLT